MLLPEKLKWKLIQPQSPARLPSWRWLLAEMIVFDETTVASRIRNYMQQDAYLRDAMTLLRHWREDPRREIEGDLADIETAHWIWAGANRWDRCLLESRLLTEASTADVAQQTLLAATIVDIYRKLFFDLDDKMFDTIYVQRFAIGETGPLDLMGVIRAIAYYEGPSALADVLAAYAAEIRTERVRDLALHRTLDPLVACAVRAAVESYMGAVLL